MTIREMHKRFRTIGQAKGLQLVRAVLPESIDEYLNAAIVEKCRSVLIQNTSTQIQGKISNDDNPTSPYTLLEHYLEKLNILLVLQQQMNII